MGGFIELNTDEGRHLVRSNDILRLAEAKDGSVTVYTFEWNEGLLITDSYGSIKQAIADCDEASQNVSRKVF